MDTFTLVYIIFAAVFGLLGLGMSIVAILGRIWILLVVGLPFTLVGIFCLHKLMQIIKDKQDLIKNGTYAIGTIVDYEDDWSLEVNGVPALILLVDVGLGRPLRVRTGSTSERGVPIGGSIGVIYDPEDPARCVIDKKAKK